MKVFSFPILCFLVVWILSFRAFKGRGVIVPLPTNSHRRNEMMEHFMIHHALDKIVWYEWLIEKPMNANEILLASVNAKANRGSLSLYGHSHPRDTCLNTIVEILLIEMMIDRIEIDIVSLWSAYRGRAMR